MAKNAERPAPAGIDRNFFFSRPAEEQKAIRRELAIIDQELCRDTDLDSCKTIKENHDAWKRLSSASPAIGLKLLSNRNHSWPVSSLSQPIPDNTPSDSSIPTDLWNKSVALWWVLNNVSQERAVVLLEHMITPDEQYATVFIEIADFAIGKSTGIVRSAVDNLKANIESTPDYKDNAALAKKVRQRLYYDVELRLAFSQP